MAISQEAGVTTIESGQQERWVEVPLDQSAPSPDVGVAPASAVEKRGRSSALVGQVAVVLAVAAAWFLLFTTVLSGLQEHSSQSRLYAKFRSELANETAPVGAPIAYGQPVALLTIPNADIHRVVVVEGSSSRQLLSAPGHKADTPLPGQIGDSEVLGRSLAYGGPFSSITDLQRGDRIMVTTGQGDFTYSVIGIRHTSTSPRLQANESLLTLVTARQGWLGSLTPVGAVYVDAKLVKGAAQPVSAPPSVVKRTSLPMAGNPNALVPMIFWLEGLAAAIGLTIFAWRRWGRWQTWIAGVPLVAGAAWGLSDALVQFLPNLL